MPAAEKRPQSRHRFIIRGRQNPWGETMYSSYRVVLVGVLLLVCSGRQLVAQPERLAQVEAIVAGLQATGVRLERPRAVVYFESGLLPEAEQARWADLISNGIDHVERFLKASFGSTKLEYYVSGKVRETSFSIDGDGGPSRIFLASDRVQRGAAPYIHEAVHHLVFRLTPQRTTAEIHFWLFEGFPSYVEDAVVARYGGAAGRVFVSGGNEAVDDEARAVLSTPTGLEMLGWLGRPGIPPGMEDRQRVAKPVYVLGQSLTKHLIDTIGLDAFVGTAVPQLLNTEKPEAEVTRLSGKSLERLAAEWRAKLGVTSSGGTPAKLQ
jgi:hypothetical protein